jgi:mycothiol synthase
VDLTWRPLASDDLAGLAALARRVVAADGGLPLVADEGFLRRRYGGAGTVAVTADGTVVAAVSVRRQDEGSVISGLVDPALRGRGIGARLLDTSLGAAGQPVTVETESLTDEATRLFASRGLEQIWAEDVMRFDLAQSLSDLALPPGVTVRTWSDGTADRFFAVYQAAFRDRPGFPGWSRQQWMEWTGDDDDFRPQWSLIAAEAADVAFVTCAEGWIVQVGVRPEERGRGLGAALVFAVLRRMRDAGRAEVLLDVNVDNPAGALYARLGFARIGRRARFSRPTRR